MPISDKAKKRGFGRAFVVKGSIFERLACATFDAWRERI
jgi:hypothetical protein